MNDGHMSKDVGRDLLGILDNVQDQVLSGCKRLLRGCGYVYGLSGVERGGVWWSVVLMKSDIQVFMVLSARPFRATTSLIMRLSTEE